MTSRSADYHVFGQTQHLAAGLVTVFANAATSKCGCGGSAFVGLDGWKSVDQKVTPYGEIGPGLFQFEKKDFGPLGESESAFVMPCASAPGPPSDGEPIGAVSQPRRDIFHR